MNIACIIPAYNEGERILDVVRTVLASQLFYQVVVVDDGSTDNMFEHLRMFRMCSPRGRTDIDLCGLEQNHGKSFAVARGLSYASSRSATHVCLLDADLVGLTVGDLDKLVWPVVIGTADATFSSRTSYKGLWHPNLDIFTGERVVPLSVLEECRLEDHTSFEMEILINGALIDSGARIQVVDWPNVSNPTKMSKYGVWQGVKRDWRMFQEMRKVGGVGKLVKQTRELRRQLV